MKKGGRKKNHDDHRSGTRSTRGGKGRRFNVSVGERENSLSRQVSRRCCDTQRTFANSFFAYTLLSPFPPSLPPFSTPSPAVVHSLSCDATSPCRIAVSHRLAPATTTRRENSEAVAKHRRRSPFIKSLPPTRLPGFTASSFLPFSPSRPSNPRPSSRG